MAGVHPPSELPPRAQVPSPVGQGGQGAEPGRGGGGVGGANKWSGDTAVGFCANPPFVTGRKLRRGRLLECMLLL